MYTLVYNVTTMEELKRFLNSRKVPEPTLGQHRPIPKGPLVFDNGLSGFAFMLCKDGLG
jgi:hypothetical protein